MKQTLYILSLFYLVLCFKSTKPKTEESQDLFTEKLYIREEDLYQIDISKYISLQNESINFRSNNPNIKLPGLFNTNSDLFKKDSQFSTLDFKFDNEYLFFLENDQRTFIQLKYEDNDFKNQETDVSKQLQEKTNLTCSDMIKLQKIIFILCLDTQGLNKNLQKYSILVYDYLDNNLIQQIQFESYLFEKPKFKSLQNLNNFQFEDSGKINLILFSNDKQKKFTDNEEFLIIEIDYIKNERKELAFVFQKQRILQINNLIFGGKKTSSKILNLIVNDLQNNNLLIFIEEYPENPKKYVYNCQFEENKEIQKIRFLKCDYHIKKQVVSFFQRNENFIYQNLNNEIHFCKKDVSNCQMGQVEPDWNISTIIIENNVGIVVMKIKNDYIFFVNDFLMKNITWAKQKQLSVNKILYYDYLKNNEIQRNLVIFQDKGFFKKNINFNKYVSISQPALENLEPIEIYQGNKMIMKLEIYPYEQDSILNTFENHLYQITSKNHQNYNCKIGWVGDNLKYLPQSSQKLYFFNNMKVYLQNNLQNSVVLGYLFYKQQLLIFYKEGVLQNQCSFGYNENILICERIQFLKMNLKQEQVTFIEQRGNILFFNHVVENQIKYINLDDISQQGSLKFQNTSQQLLYCKLGLEIFLCVFEDKNQIFETLKFFNYDNMKLNEVVYLNDKFQKNIKNLQKTMRNKELTKVVFKNIIFDQSDLRKVLIHLGVVYNINIENYFIDFQIYQQDLLNWTHRIDLQNNTDIKLDSKIYVKDSNLTILSIDPKFKLFGYDQDSYFVMSYLSVKKLLKIQYSSQNNLMAIIYESLQDQNIYFALLKLTKNAVKQIIRIENIENFGKYTELSLLEFDQDLTFIFIYQEGGIQASYIYYNKGPILNTESLDLGLNISSNSYQLRFVEDTMFNVSGYRIIKDPMIEIENWQQSQILKIKDYFEFNGNLSHLEVTNKNQIKDIEIEQPLKLSQEEKLSDIADEEFTYVQNDQIIRKYENSIELYFMSSKKTQNYYDLFSSSCEFQNYYDNYFYCAKQNGVYQTLYIYKLKDNFAQTYQLVLAGSKFQILISNQSHAMFFAQSLQNDKIIAYKQINKADKLQQYVINKSILSISNLNITDYFVFLDRQTNLISLIIFDQENNNLILHHFDQLYKTKKTLKNNINLDFIEPHFNQIKCQQPQQNIILFQCVLISDVRIYLLEIKKSLNVVISNFTWDINILHEYYNIFKFNQMDYQDLLIQWDSDYLFLLLNQQENSKLVMYNFQQELNVFYQQTFENQQIEDMKIKEINDQNVLQMIIIDGNDTKFVTYVIQDYQLLVRNPSHFKNDGVKFKALFENNNQYELVYHFYSNGVVQTKKKKNIKSLRIFLIVCIALVSLLILMSISLLIWFFWDRKKKNMESQINESFDGPSFRITRLSESS